MSDKDNTVMVRPAGSIDGIVADISRTLKQYDKRIGSSPEDSLALLWERAWEVKDVNDIVQNNLRQTQVMIEDLYRKIFTDRTEHAERILELQQKLQSCEKEEQSSLIREIIVAESSHGKNQIAQMKLINTLVKTNRELANEIRQSAMARRFNIHISDVKKMAIAFRAVLHDRIQDVNLLCRISEDLDGVMKKIFPIKADGDY